MVNAMRSPFNTNSNFFVFSVSLSFDKIFHFERTRRRHWLWFLLINRQRILRAHAPTLDRAFMRVAGFVTY